MTQDKYVDPETGILRNLLGITNPKELEKAEADFTRRRIRELEEFPIPGQFDLAHLQAIHRHLTQDLVSWAGEVREINISKGYMFCPVENLHSYAQDIFGSFAAKGFLRGLSREEFVLEVAHFYGDVNALHPFREFNGRTQRVFFSQLAHEAKWHIAWDRMNPQQNIDASIASFQGRETLMRKMFDELIETLGRLGK